MGLIERNAEPKEGVTDVRPEKPTETPSAQSAGQEPKAPAPEKPDLDQKPTPSEIEVKAQALLKTAGVDDLEELEDLLTEAHEIKGKLGDKDIETLLRSQEELTRRISEIEEARLKAARENETPEETAARLEKELHEEKTKNQRKEKADRDQKAAIEEAQKAVAAYGKTIKELLDTEPGLTEEDKAFIAFASGVENPFNDIKDITNKREVTKAFKQILKTWNGHRQTTVKGYRDGKIKIPDITPAGPGVAPDPSLKVGNLKDARKIASARLFGHFDAKHS